jgi:hypothetical protein
LISDREKGFYTMVPYTLIGEIVHYVAYNGTCLAAMIIGDNGNDGQVLVVWTCMQNVNGVTNYGQQFHTGVHSSVNMGQPGTWHERH